MENSDCWSVLGIAPTDDIKAIRRAYAALLRALDVERDPHGFVALRTAYETALVPIAYAELSFPELEIADEQPWHHEMTAIHGLLGEGADRVTIFAPLASLTARLVAHAQQCSLIDSQAIEQWVSDTIVDGIPRSNGMLEPAITGFRWAEQIEDHDCPYEISVAWERREDARYIRELQAINPHYNLAWTALTEGVDDLTAIHPASVTTLLGIVQHQRPGLLDDVDLKQLVVLTDFVAAQRAADRRAGMAEITASNVPLVRPRIELAAIIGYYAVGVFLNLAALHLFVFEHSFITFLMLGIVGAVLIAVANERRLRRKLRLGAARSRR